MLVTPSTTALSDDVEKESQKVRSMYEQGSNFDWREGKYSGNTDLNLHEGKGAEVAPIA
jgi:hypothetical protein